MQFPVADAHCDYLYGAVQSGYRMQSPKRDQVISMDELSRGNVALQFFAAWTDMTLRASPLHQCVAMIDAYQTMLRENPALTPLTPDFLPGQGKIATVLTVEGGEATEGSYAVLRTLYRLGVRAMTLTWNDNNELAGAAKSRSNRGLTALGRDIVAEMHKLGIAVDVAHLSDRGIDDVLSEASRPVFASHSNARAVCNAARCLQDAHIRAIAEQGGVIGVNFYYEQLTTERNARIDDVVKHICHIVRIGGIRCCAIGSDFDGMQRYPVDLKSCRDYPKLWRALAEVGFTEEEIYRISYANLRDYIVQFV